MQYLAARNAARIFVAARSAAKAEAAMADIDAALARAGVARVAPMAFLELDLGSLASVRAAAAAFHAQSDRLDVLVNNAGIMLTPAAPTADGFDEHFGVNHVGHALLVRLLLDTLLATAARGDGDGDVRVVTVSSSAHLAIKRGWLRTASPTSVAGMELDQAVLARRFDFSRYAQSKLANVLFAAELAARHPELTSVSVHPGIILTDLYGPLRARNFVCRCLCAVWAALAPVLPDHYPDAAAGARCQVWAATAKKEDLVNGEFYLGVGRKGGSFAAALDAGPAKKLWEWTEAELQSRGF